MMHVFQFVVSLTVALWMVMTLTIQVYEFTAARSQEARAAKPWTAALPYIGFWMILVAILWASGAFGGLGWRGPGALCDVTYLGEVGS